MPQESRWKEHIVVCPGCYKWSGDAPPSEPRILREKVEPWLAALLQVEHLNLLVGSGLTLAIASQVKVSGLDMTPWSFATRMADAVEKAATKSAARCERGQPNIEDQVRAILELIGGLQILAESVEPGRNGNRLAKSAARLLKEWEGNLDFLLKKFLKRVLDVERAIEEQFGLETEESERAQYLLGSFLLTFASRPASRERLHIFTTNYDRLLEYACDMLGLRILDRFVGQLLPVFRSSRLGVDFHYCPPGIRGEPRYLEGVVRITKLHGSIDWRRDEKGSGRHEIVRYGIPFGAMESDAYIASCPGNSIIIYPNPAKDIETLEYPYADLFRDFAAALCQPNTVLVTYGYGFGDAHINRVIRDMLTIPSTHLVIVSYDDAGGRIQRFYEMVGHSEQITLLIGNHFGDLGVLVEHYLPKPAIEKTSWQAAALMERRKSRKNSSDDNDSYNIFEGD
ncbi:MAG: hypothetical protein PWQ86_1173 [Bacillota bacterium]|nr:hypothetical protein [Bacillota bacterium]